MQLERMTLAALNAYLAQIEALSHAGAAVAQFDFVPVFDLTPGSAPSMRLHGPAVEGLQIQGTTAGYLSEAAALQTARDWLAQVAVPVAPQSEGITLNAPLSEPEPAPPLSLPGGGAEVAGGAALASPPAIVAFPPPAEAPPVSQAGADAGGASPKPAPGSASALAATVLPYSAEEDARIVEAVAMARASGLPMGRTFDGVAHDLGRTRYAIEFRAKTKLKSRIHQRLVELQAAAPAVAAVAAPIVRPALEPDPHRPWTDDEDAQLLDACLAAKRAGRHLHLVFPEVGKALGRGQPSVSNRFDKVIASRMDRLLLVEAPRAGVDDLTRHLAQLKPTAEDLELMRLSCDNMAPQDVANLLELEGGPKYVKARFDQLTGLMQVEGQGEQAQKPVRRFDRAAVLSALEEMFPAQAAE